MSELLAYLLLLLPIAVEYATVPHRPHPALDWSDPLEPHDWAKIVQIETKSFPPYFYTGHEDSRMHVTIYMSDFRTVHGVMPYRLTNDDLGYIDGDCWRENKGFFRWMEMERP